MDDGVAPGKPDGGVVSVFVVAGETVVSHKGRLWRCKVTHVTHAGWVPSAATHAVWTDIGPA